MYKIIGPDGKEYGPVSESDLRKWVAEERIHAVTLAEKEGEPGWKPLSSFAEFADLFAVPDPEAYTAEILARPVGVEIGKSLSRSWNLYKSQFGPIFGATLLITVCSIAINAVPYIGVFIGWFFQGVLFAGLYWFFLKWIRGQKAEIGDAFSGFNKPVLPQLMLASVVTNVFLSIGFLVGAIPFLLSFIPAIWEILKGANPNPEVLLRSISVGAVMGLLLGTGVMVFLYVLWVFTLPLVIDKGFGFWQAMELSRKVVMKALFSVLGLVIVSGLVSVSGVLLCCVGLFFTMPISFGALAFAYEDIFGKH